MGTQAAALSMGAKILTGAEADAADLGPLTQLQGTWTGQPFDGWNVIAVPGPATTQGFTLEVIPYQETISFTPVVIAGNRGPFLNGVQQEQNLFGLLYEQQITSVCDTPLCQQMGFGAGQVIHAETGIFLNVSNFNSNFNVARLSTIPHGNSVLALGKSIESTSPGNDFFGTAPTLPTNLDGGSINVLGYSEVQYFKQQFPDFDQMEPNSFLQATLLNNKNTINSMTTLVLDTNNPNATGGILNIPFVQENARATTMTSIFWIESLQNPTPGGPDILQLQYTQTINLVFPPTGSIEPIIWPHVTINTLLKTV